MPSASNTQRRCCGFGKTTTPICRRSPDGLREWRHGRGCEVVARGERIPIVGVRLLGPELVGIELAADAPRELELRYALAAGA